MGTRLAQKEHVGDIERWDIARDEMAAAGLYVQDGEYPTDVYPASLAAFINQATIDIGCPHAYLAAGVLPILGAAIGGHTTIHIGGSWNETPAIWLALVGPPGAKKTPATKTLTRPLWDIDNELDQGNRYALETWDNDDPKTRGEQPIERHAVVNDTTIEALCDTLRNNPKLIMHSDELTGWVNSFNQYRPGGRDRQHWLSIWSNASIKVQRKNKRIADSIPNPYISVLGGVQPGLLSTFAGDDGLFPRLLYAHGEATSGTLPDDQPTPHYDTYKQTVNQLWKQKPCIVDLTPKAHDLADTWYQTQEHKVADNQDGLGEVHAKMQGYMFRFALILNRLDSVNEGNGPATVDHIERAVTLVDWFTQSALEAGRMDDRSNQKDIEWSDKLGKLSGWLEQHPGCTRTHALKNGPRWARNANVLDQALEALGVDLSRIKPPGRPGK